MDMSMMMMMAVMGTHRMRGATDQQGGPDTETLL